MCFPSLVAALALLAHFYQARDSAGVRIVENAPSTAGRDLSLGPAPRFRLDGSESGREPFFRVPTKGIALVGSHGFVVANAGAYELRFYGTDGALRVAGGRSGQGPGEFGFLSWIGTLTPDSVLAYDTRRRVLSIWTSSGVVAREVVLASLPAARPSGAFVAFTAPTLQAVLRDGSVVYISSAGLKAGSGIQQAHGAIMRFDPVTTRADTVVQAMIADYVAPAPPARRVTAFGRHISLAVSGDHVSITEGGEYRIESFTAEGRLVRSVRVKRAARRVTTADREAFLRAQSGDPVPEATFPERLPAYDELWHDGDGHLWAAIFRAPTDATARWDVFDRQGVLLCTLAVPRDLRLQAADARHVYGVRVDSDGVQYVESYQLPAKLRTGCSAPDR